MAGLTQIEAAQMLNVTQGTISQWENGNSYPTGKRLVEVANLYHCTIDQLFERKEETA
jgi:transcriptional regulator with XRE-family HTH domain